MSSQIELGNQTFNPQSFQKELEDIKQVTIMRLHLNYNPNIVKQISPFRQKFNSLLILNLGYNKIVNLEPLHTLPLDNLEELHLFSNKIGNLRSLRKCHFPHLKYLSLVHNHIRSLKGLEQMNCPQLNQLYTYDNPLHITAPLLRSNFNTLRSVELGQIMNEFQCTEWLLMVRFSGVAEAALGIDEQL